MPRRGCHWFRGLRDARSWMGDCGKSQETVQLTDEVHWRDVYERDGTLRSYAMGSKKIGKWFVHSDELCLDLPEPDGGCFEVTATGTNFVLNPKGLGSPLEGILQAPPD